MSQIIINYDLLHVIKEAKGIKKVPKGFSIISKPLELGYPVAVLINSINDQYPANVVVPTTVIAATISIGFGELILSIMAKKTTMDLANIKLELLSKQLNNLSIKTSPELLLKSQVYHKDYSFNKDDLGIIRNRYINVPIYNYNREEITTSIKEEHLLTTNNYVLKLGTPQAKKEKALRKSFGTI